MALAELPGRLRLAPGTHPKLVGAAAGERFGWREDQAERVLAHNRERLAHLQYKMYADGRFGMIVLLQGIDGSGKDGTIRHVVSAFNPQGYAVTSFKVPTSEEARHDYLWRVHQRAPRRGEIAVFNRSHYEDVIAVRVGHLAPPRVWRPRFEQINAFEHYLSECDIHVVKVFLHISKAEQRRRFLARIRTPHKQWKFDPSDLGSRRQWSEYRRAFNDALERCNTAWAPWYVVPADHKWFRNLAVSQILRERLESLPLRWPAPSFDPARVRIHK